MIVASITITIVMIIIRSSSSDDRFIIMSLSPFLNQHKLCSLLFYKILKLAVDVCLIQWCERFESDNFLVIVNGKHYTVVQK